ncbi:MAG TPA: S9 family peptidase [Candidatus Dormibacteraeota bacterium]|nr:S9 family peptidase [Candidatus Dormibacteraeota bacterium]
MSSRTGAVGFVAFVLICAAAVPVAAQQKRPITFQDLAAMHRLSGPQISPDGKWIAYEAGTPNLEANRVVHDIWLVSAEGGDARQITRGGSDMRPRWSPDGKWIAFLSSRDGEQQVYWITLDGGDANRLTSLSGGADTELWSPDGKWIAFFSSVYPDCKDEACNAERKAQSDKSKVKARIYEHLLYRHWNGWSDGTRSHLFVMPAGGGAARDLTPGADYDVPPFNLGDPDAIAFSPDSSELCFTANTDPDAALSTNGDLFTVPVAGGAAPKRITTNPANDWGPAYSPDGKWIAYRAQTHPGWESDRWRLRLYDRSKGEPINLTENVDRSIDSFAWSTDGKAIYFATEEKSEMPVFSIAPVSGSTPKLILGDSFNNEIGVSNDGRALVFTRTSLTMPAEVFTSDADGKNVRQITHQNEAILAQLDLSPMETFWFAGAGKTQVEGLMVKPPNFDASKKYPMLLLIHGGPQQAWTDAWGYRWNQQMMASPGYVVVMVNPRGSPGYGEKFEADVSRDWGGKVYEDVMKGADAAVAKYPFIDGTRLAAAGGSFGGYMVDWIATHSNRFKCLISHAGSYDMVSMYGATEELWFMDWEFGGPPWSHAELYKKYSPSEYAPALGKYKTPTLVVGGELDFRIPYTQDLEFFTALQRQGVPSKLLLFPDEGHWVLKPQNSQLWYKTFLDWLAKYLH